MSLLAGPLLLGWGLWTAWEGLEARGWPEAEGRVLSSETVRKRKGRREPRVVYAYQVAGRSYESDRVAAGATDTFLSLFPFLGDAEATVARYPTGAKVTLRHHPEDPGSAVLETPFPWGGIGMAAVGLAFAVFGAAGVRRLLRGTPASAGPPPG